MKKSHLTKTRKVNEEAWGQCSSSITPTLKVPFNRSISNSFGLKRKDECCDYLSTRTAPSRSINMWMADQHAKHISASDETHHSPSGTCLSIDGYIDRNGVMQTNPPSQITRLCVYIVINMTMDPHNSLLPQKCLSLKWGGLFYDWHLLELQLYFLMKYCLLLNVTPYVDMFVWSSHAIG